MSSGEKIDKRAHILMIAEQLFADNGFDGTSVRDIAQQANVNLAMISYYFGSKEKLLGALIEERAGYTLGILEELNKNPQLSPWEKVCSYIDYYVEKVMTNYRFHCIMTQQTSNSRSAEIREQLIGIKLRNLEQVKKVITDGQRKGLFRKIDIEFTIASIMGTLSHVTNSRAFYCRMLKIDETDDRSFHKKIAPRLKEHLKQLMRAHLDIKNEE